jgi:2-dehydropantoate 2-reductase
MSIKNNMSGEIESMHEVPDLLLIGDGRLARHLARYFAQLGISHAVWSRRMHAEGRCPDLATLVRSQTHVLLAISDSAIETFVSGHPELEPAVRIHFSGGLATPLAIGAHPLFSFANALYERELYERIPFVIDERAPPLSALIPGLPNPSFFISPEQRARYHALCVLAGNFTTLLWRKLFFELDRQYGVPREQALPYLESVTRGLAERGAPLSGPLSRGDTATIARNLEALKDDPFARVYRAFVEAYEQQQDMAADGAGKDWLAP